MRLALSPSTMTSAGSGMEFDDSQAVAQMTYNGQAYSFCSEDCRKTFEENPSEFVDDSAPRGDDDVIPIA